ncbi:MAG: Molybdopterin biosynthesis protein MoeA / Periplasmic molybdate-binding domain [Anaerolineae bacterium]|jgi:putative molybdopterin biosynthesis protein|nr:MAG: Molybdopterin biosynthesis protein MoeA / Periplasmic molybdate-binding domain [Anaerolineae bacterium]
MDTVSTLSTYLQIEALADPQRLTILQHLMASPATLTQLAHQLNHSPAWVRHHLKRLEEVGLVEFLETRKRGRQIERYYRAVAGAFLIQQMVLPKTSKPVMIFSGSDDFAWKLLADSLSTTYHILTLPVGSLNGLINLRQGFCQICGSHLYDETSDEYNLPALRQLFPDRSLTVITLAHRLQGLILNRGNPKGIHHLTDLLRPEVRLINRNQGSGTRIRLEKAFHQAGIDPHQVQGFDQEVNTHTQAAQWVATGKADVAIGLQSAAAHYQLDFIPLFEERYDLILDERYLADLSMLTDFLVTQTFRKQIAQLPGYSSRRSGDYLQLSRRQRYLLSK